MDFSAIEQKWQKEWQKNGLGKAKTEKGKPKFFLIFAYPGVSGFLHVGHMRGFTYADVITRYKRMNGYNVLFPAGFHASGLPAIAYSAKVKRKEPGTIEQLKSYGLNETQIKELEDPHKAIEFYKRVYVEDFWKPFGFLIDYERQITTIQPEYNRFIEWQFKKLHQLGLLTQKPHFAPYCPEMGPIAIDTSETDISQGGNAQILEYTVVKFKFEGYVLPTATLRPETVYGVTNLWLNPETTLVVVNYHNEKWLFTKEAAEKIIYQKEGFQITEETIPAEKLIGKKCHNSVNNTDMYILPGPFVDAGTGTGIVMSVPSHAPYDWIALHELKEHPEKTKPFHITKKQLEEIQPISLINSPGYGEQPAEEEIHKLGIKNQLDEKLEEATKNLYNAEFHTGRLNWRYAELEGEKVSDVKEKIIQRFQEQNLVDTAYGFSEKVVSRAGCEVVIKRVPDQWFIRYSDKELTEKSVAQAQKMNILPEQYRKEMPGVLEWFSDRACVRQGNWLGTKFPIDPKWIVEPISDSTLYPLTYLYSRFVNEGKLNEKHLTEAFFDFVFLGKGNANEVAKQTGCDLKVIQQVREEFEYWYPLDVNLGGKEHKTVHFPVFLMNHVAVLPEQKWPQGIFVHWWVVGETGKISKSKGGAASLHDLAKRFSIDALRLYYCNVGNPHVDIVFNEETAQKYRQTLERNLALIEKLLAFPQDKKQKQVDEWLEAKANQRFSAASEAMEQLQLKEFSETVYYLFPLDLKWYLQREGSNKALVKKILEQWITTMALVTPHLAEELWHGLLKQNSLVSSHAWPSKSAKPNLSVLQAEELIDKLLEDIENIKQLAKIEKPTKITLFPAPKWKWRAVRVILNASEEKPDFKAAMEAVMKNADLRPHGQEIQGIIKKVLSDLGPMRNLQELDEYALLQQEKRFLEQKLGCTVEIEKESPAPKAKNAFPGKPAIQME